jgi:hypothetical protein
MPNDAVNISDRVTKGLRKINLLWDVEACRFTDTNTRFEGTSRLHLQGSKTIGTLIPYLPNYTTSHSIRP